VDHPNSQVDLASFEPPDLEYEYMLNSHCQAERTVVMSAYLTEIEVVLSQELG